MKLKIPPPIYFALTALVMWLIARNTNFMEFAFPGQAFLALLLAVGGIAVGAMALAHFSKAKTTFHPTDPEKTTVIVDSGVYAISRNPMYLGLAMGLAGIAIYFGAPLNMVPLIVFIWIITEMQIKPEEDILRKNFGEPYEAYCRRVRRWI